MTTFLDDAGMDFAVRCVLSGVRSGMAEVGEVLTLCERVTDGDPDSWLQEWTGFGRELAARADRAASTGRRATAWSHALRAANYLFAGAWWAPVTSAAGREDQLWAEHRAAWDLSVAHWPTPADQVELPGRHALPGYWFNTSVGDGPAPAVVLVQGLDTPMSDACMTGLVDGLTRGHHVLCLDGPGQGAALYRDGLTLVPDWEEVLGPVLDWVTSRPEVQGDRVVLMGVNHGAWFAARAASRLDGIAALVLDPGVDDLAGDARASVAAPGIDGVLADHKTRRPFEETSLEDALAALDAFRLTAEELSSVTCPTFVAEAESAAGFVGQPARVAAAIGASAHLHRFTSAEGAGLDCEIAAPQIRNDVVYDWLDDTLDTRRNV